ncbi:MAG TPA: hypothetical protein VEB63_05040 [Chitinophagaceae bacterium]|nr:hypothetical protein [Chitinophagaceae bacterium]
MRLLTLSTLLLLSAIGYGQEGLFLRLYNENGKKFQTGYLIETTDSSLILKSSGKLKEIPVTEISQLRLRRSFGHIVLISVLAGGTAMAIAGAGSADPDNWILPMTVAEGLIAGFLLGGGTALAPGALISAARKRPVFEVRRDPQKWKELRLQLQRFLLE